MFIMKAVPGGPLPCPRTLAATLCSAEGGRYRFSSGPPAPGRERGGRGRGRRTAHPTPRRARHRLSVPRYSQVCTFRRLPRDWPELWKTLLRWNSRVALEQLSLRLLDYDGACARSAAVHADLTAVERFFDDEASMLARAITATGYAGYPVPQRERDALFLRYRDGRRADHAWQ